jgi:hypothetical protein
LLRDIQEPSCFPYVLLSLQTREPQPARICVSPFRIRSRRACAYQNFCTVSARHGARDFVSQKLAKEDTARISELRRIVMITAILVALAIVAIRLAGATVNEAVLGTVAEGRNRICGLHIDTKGELQC